MQRHLDQELQTLNNHLLKMATLTEEAIHKCVESLKVRNIELAKEVAGNDQKIDDLENKIEESSIELLALFQPMANDLRFITTGMHISSNLERIADLTVNISRRVIELADKPLLKPLVDIPRLAEIAKRMVRTAIESFIQRNDELAKSVIFSDKEADELRTNIIKELIYEHMVKDGTTAPRAVPLLLVARDLERICDHATNIAEDVIYMIDAKIVKHHLEELISTHKKVNRSE
ncbi:MAG: phosphate signaling complex protein PhoU [Candidatus Omnitrophica bacterium]|nr:phosphate signaling complex protein PhoU [Candidatus Omnitrophota bacterium]